jgi:hypothetical protein
LRVMATACAGTWIDHHNLHLGDIGW